MIKTPKYYLNEIFNKFIEPYFSLNNYIISLEWDTIYGAYKYVVTPKGNLNKFISLYLFGHGMKNNFEMRIIYTHIDEFNNHYTKKLTFLLAFDDINRFNNFYKDFINELDEKSLNDINIGVLRPILPVFIPKRRGKYTS